MVFDTLHLAIIIFLAVAFIFAASPLVLGFLLAPRTHGGDYLMPYECGMVPHNRAWGHFGMNYYIYALIFIAFDVDILYLFPISAFYRNSIGLLPFIELSFFLCFVFLAILYFRSKGVFEWPRRIKVERRLHLEADD